MTTLGREFEAETAYREALALRPEFPEALVALADLLNRLGRPQHAEDYARRAASAPAATWRSPTDAWKASITLAAVCIELGKKFNDSAMFDEAVLLVESARRRIPTALSTADLQDAALLRLLRGYALTKLERPGEAESEFRKCAKEAPANSAVGLVAARNARRLNARLRNRIIVPVWVPYALSASIVAAGLYAAWLVRQGRLALAEFLAWVGVGILLMLAAFSLPALTRLKVGPAELQKETAFAVPARLELLTTSRIATVPAQGSTPEIALRLWTVATVAVLAMPGRAIKPPPRQPRQRFDFAATLRGETARFRVWAAQNVPASAADLLLESCERDYERLAAHFPKGAGPFNVLLVNEAGAYHHSCQATDIYFGLGQIPSERTVLMYSVSQVAEVLAARAERRWDCGTSAGEGLSRALAGELYPDLMRDFTTAASWLDSNDRPDYVNKSSQTDTDLVATSCSVLFLNYLRYHLGYGWRDIVVAGGANLGATYRALTGKADGFARFSDLMQTRIPQGMVSGLDNDNPFPIRDS